MNLSDCIQLLTPVSIIGGLIFAYIQYRNTKDNMTKRDTEHNNTVLMEIKILTTSISDIKAELSYFKSDHDKIIILERDMKTALKMIDEFKRDNK